MLSCWIILLYLWKVRKELGESFFVTVLAVQSGLEFRSQHPLVRPDAAKCLLLQFQSILCPLLTCLYTEKWEHLPNRPTNNK